MSGTPGSAWIRACGVDDIQDEEALRLNTQPPVSVFRSGGEFLCVDDICTHEDFSLAEGWIEGGVVECPLHLARFCLRTGAVLSPPATRPLRAHEVRVEGADVYVRIAGGPAPACQVPEGLQHGMA